MEGAGERVGRVAIDNTDSRKDSSVEINATAARSLASRAKSAPGKLARKCYSASIHNVDRLIRNVPTSASGAALNLRRVLRSGLLDSSDLEYDCGWNGSQRRFHRGPPDELRVFANYYFNAASRLLVGKRGSYSNRASHPRIASFIIGKNIHVSFIIARKLQARTPRAPFLILLSCFASYSE